MPEDCRDPASAKHLSQALLNRDAPDQRVRDAWFAWLRALASDPDAAHAAAIAYRDLCPEGRNHWLSALEQDAASVAAPRFALFAPLLAVEGDRTRRSRILESAAVEDEFALPTVGQRALRGGAAGAVVAAIISPLYLDFVQVLACGFTPGKTIGWVKHDPITREPSVPKPGDHVNGVSLEPVPLPSLIDELSVTVWAHQRAGGDIPEALRVHADLFTASESSDCFFTV